MIKSVKKIPVLRYGLIVLLVCILFSGAFYLYIRYNSARKLQANINGLITARQNSDLIDSCLLNLYDADNSSRLYAVTGDKKYIQSFSQKINSLSGFLSRIKDGGVGLSYADSVKLSDLISQKSARTNSYVKLRLYTDSLIHMSSRMAFMLNRDKIKIPSTTIKTVKTTERLDTIKSTDKAANKKFFGRLFSAVTGGKKQPALVVKRDTETQVVTQTADVYAPIPKKERRYYSRINSANDKLKNNEQAILLINNNLLAGIIAELQRYRSVEQRFEIKKTNNLSVRITDVFNEYSSLSKLTLAALILLVAVVLYNIWKIFANQQDILLYSEKAQEYADNKSRFMASMSHEIRTPLNSVIGFSEQLSMSKLSPEQTVQINAIRNSSAMLLDVVNEILDFSKYVTGKMMFEQQPFMLHKALTDVFNSVSIQAAKKELKFRKEFSFDEDLCLAGDAIRLKQVIINLLVNAIKFTPAGEVLLQARITKSGEYAVLKVRVKDSGIGIKKQNLPLVFEEFSQVSDAQKVTQQKGTGLGLAICKKIIEQQGGSIKVISEPGKGSVFSFELPLLVADKSACEIENPLSNEQLASHVTGAHVLLADDNQLNVLLAKTILQKWKITCDVAADGQEAYNLFKQKKFDVVLTDIEMPIMGGLEFLSLVRKAPNNLKAETPVIVMTANVLKEDRDRYFAAGTNEIVLKPFDERNLVEKISVVLKNKYANIENLLIKYEE